MFSIQTFFVRMCKREQRKSQPCCKIVALGSLRGCRGVCLWFAGFYGYDGICVWARARHMNFSCPRPPSGIYMNKSTAYLAGDQPHQQDLLSCKSSRRSATGVVGASMWSQRQWPCICSGAAHEAPLLVCICTGGMWPQRAWCLVL